MASQSQPNGPTTVADLAPIATSGTYERGAHIHDPQKPESDLHATAERSLMNA